MSRPLLTTRQMALPLAIGLAMPIMAPAQTVGTSTGASKTLASVPPSTSRLAASYATWAGSTANAQSLVNGLSTGNSVNLSGSTGSTSFSPSTGKLGVGETGIALSLAKAILEKQGITNPTPAQISAALNGGLISSATGTMSVPGVLSQRASGMGWGEIAQAMGVKLGAVVSASKTDKSKAAQAGTKPHTKDNPGMAHAQNHATHASSSESHGAGHSGGGHGGGGGGKK